MCIISDKIKFCSCENLPLGDYYWQIHRRKEGFIVIGSVHLNNISENTYLINVDTLLKRLSDADAFDFEYLPEEDDKFSVTLMIDKSKMDYQEYFFKFKKGKWDFISSLDPYEKTDKIEKQGCYITFMEGKIREHY
jgi:hypothetical protein